MYSHTMDYCTAVKKYILILCQLLGEIFIKYCWVRTIRMNDHREFSWWVVTAMVRVQSLTRKLVRAAHQPKKKKRWVIIISHFCKKNEHLKKNLYMCLHMHVYFYKIMNRIWKYVSYEQMWGMCWEQRQWWFGWKAMRYSRRWSQGN